MLGYVVRAVQYTLPPDRKNALRQHCKGEDAEEQVLYFALNEMIELRQRVRQNEVKAKREQAHVRHEDLNVVQTQISVPHCNGNYQIDDCEAKYNEAHEPIAKVSRLLLVKCVFVFHIRVLKHEWP